MLWVYNTWLQRIGPNSLVELLCIWYYYIEHKHRESTAMILVTYVNIPWLVTAYVYDTAGERITVWFSRSQESFIQTYSGVGSEVQLILPGPKFVLGEIWATVARLLQYMCLLKKIESLYIWTQSCPCRVSKYLWISVSDFSCAQLGRH